MARADAMCHLEAMLSQMNEHSGEFIPLESLQIFVESAEASGISIDDVRLPEWNGGLLHMAAEIFDYKALKCLLDAGANPLVENENGDACWDLYLSRHPKGPKLRKAQRVFREAMFPALMKRSISAENPDFGHSSEALGEDTTRLVMLSM